VGRGQPTPPGTGLRVSLEELEHRFTSLASLAGCFNFGGVDCHLKSAGLGTVG
jgi:hypothetical protein